MHAKLLILTVVTGSQPKKLHCRTPAAPLFTPQGAAAFVVVATKFFIKPVGGHLPKLPRLR
jgi:hypothetical protein